MYSVYDAKAGSFAQPFFSVNEQLALRAVSAVMADEAHTFFLHAEDYTLYYLGDWDDETGALEPKQPAALANLNSLKRETIDG